MDKRNASSGLRSTGVFGKKPIIGLIMFVVGALVFIILAYSLVMNGLLIKWDLPIAEGFHALALESPAFVIDIMIAGYYLGIEGIAIVAILLGFYFLYKRFWHELVMTAVAVGGAALLFPILSNIFQRPRPFLLFDKMIWPSSPNIHGFPSGHALSIVVLCGFLVYLLLPRIKSYSGKVLTVLIALLVLFYVGFSRLYIGDHYLTDIVAGYAVGIAWFGLACTSVELLFQRYNSGKVN